MDTKATVDELRRAVNKFTDERDWGKYHTPKEIAISLSCEAAELNEIFLFKGVDDCEEIIKGKRFEDVKDEIADVLWMCLRFSEVAGVDLSEALLAKLEKSAKKYPIEKCKGKNKKWNEYCE